jgi:hypothetical protein
MKKESRNKFWIITIFAIAMGFLEAAVVVYVRRLFYPEGFNFPLKGFLEPEMLNIEWVRELATIIMLVMIAMLAAKKFHERFAYFLYAFAIWDIFYYVFLKITLNWPSSILDWDLLFLIPWPWIGPVLTPIIVSLMFTIMAFIIINLEDSRKNIRINAKEWVLMIVGVLIVLYTWLKDYAVLVFNSGFAKDFFTLSTNIQFNQIIENYSPANYNWPLFILGCIISLIGIIQFYLRTKH